MTVVSCCARNAGTPAKKVRNRIIVSMPRGPSDSHTGPPRRSGGSATDPGRAVWNTVIVAGYDRRGTSRASSRRLNVA